MAVLLDQTQQKQVGIKRLKPEQLPKWYNGASGLFVKISTDFEAFLILQGRPRCKEAVDWVQKANKFALADADRDSLVNSCAKNEIDDATTAAKELAPVVESFNKFRDRFNMTGFEGVTEVGQLLSDMQRPMSEIMMLGSRLTHRKQSAQYVQDRLINNGLTKNQTKQLNSWFEPLTTY